MNTQDREALKAGDPVGRYDQYSAALLTVKKRTATQVTLSDDSRWIVRSGSRVGASTWSYESLCTAVEAKARIDEIRAKKAVRELVQRLERIRWCDLSVEQLTKLNKLVDEIEQEAG